MSVKSLFDDKNPYKLLSSENLENLGAEVESSGNLKQRTEEKNRFIPIVNFEFPENFARYGKASKYYEDSFNRILDDYPYDGSLREKTEFRNESSYLDLYILDNKYPRTTGHAIFSPNGWGTPAATTPAGIALPSTVEFVQVKGGPNQAPDEFLNQPISKQFLESNKYDPANNRESNLKFDFNQGVTVEFWMNKGAFISSTRHEVPFMLSNEDSGSLAIVLDTSLTGATQGSFYALWTSGSTSRLLNYGGIENQEFTGSWHHFAFTFQNSGSNVVSKAYLDGELKQAKVSIGGAINEVAGALKANIGAARKLDYPSAPLFDIPSDGYGKLSGSIDEFRYWKTVRSSKEIGRYWFTETGGGTNDDIANTDLGVYFKFNEGITGTTSIDSNVLDYSGRISNGTWTGYTPQARSTSSAVDTYFDKEVEFKDPIIYSSHPDVTQIKADLIQSGSEYDIYNNASIYNSIPSWITEEDEQNGSELLKLTQIMSSYFDTLHLQIEALPGLKDKIYNDPAKIKPSTFVSKILDSQGFIAPEIFADADVISQILKRDEKRKFELDLYDIKNVIYNNIYNNLESIYKSKGTERSFRNLIRCFGVGDELIRMNVYGNNSEYQIRENYRTVSVKKRFADFNNPDRFAATVYQQTSSANPNTVSFIKGSPSASHNPFTVESEIVFPKKLQKRERGYFPTPFLTASLFGFHSASSGGTDYTWGSPDTDLKIYAIRDELESSNVYFKLDAAQLGVSLESDLFYDVYDNNKWNISARIKPQKVGANLVSGSSNTDYLLEFTGFNMDAGVIVNQFHLTASISNIQNYTTSNKRLYLGAHRTNFTGSALHQTDVKITSLRYWASYLEDETLQAHSRDPDSYGAHSPYRSTFLYDTALSGVHVPQIETLALNWDFATVTSSDAGVSGIPTVSDAGYLVEDVSSGSLSLSQRYRWLGEITKLQHTGRGDFYLPNDTRVTDVKFIYGAVKTNPEIVQASDMINIYGESDVVFTRETRPINYHYSIEKSMYQTISDEMLKMFSTILDFNTLIGDPINKYRQNYKPMEKLRSLFFEKVENTPDLDRYIEFYKWLDDSLGVMLQQLVPMSVDSSEGIRTMVESHILERNKYQHKLPTIEFKSENPETGLKGLNDSLLNWKFYHHPVSGFQDENCQWWNERAERTNPTISSGDSAVDADRQAILEARASALNRQRSTPYRLNIQRTDEIRGGSNTFAPKARDIARNQIKFGTTNGIELAQQRDFKDCTDDVLPGEKRKIIADMSATPNVEYLNVDFNQYFPYTLFSSSVGTGYQAGLGYALNNVHEDVYGYDFGTPMQSPFTENHVGGLQFRHAPLNVALDDITTRPEGWKLETSPTLKITSVDTDKPRAPYYRDETAKRPLNIKNIKGDYGNYTKDYQIVQTNSRYINNKAWVSASGWDLFPTGSPSIWIAGLNDTPKIQRGRTEHVFVNRFSAPGGPETMGDSDGGAGLDRYSAEFSPNNDINTRNITVREDFNQKLSSHVNQFGYFSGVNVPGAASSSVNPTDYSGTGSIYQVNRNTLERLEYSGSQVITASFYDNYFVQHAIPRPERDFEYNWSGSLESDFVSFTSSIKFGKTSGSAGSTYYIPTAYNGLNYNVYEPITPNSASLGLENGASIQYLNNTLITDGLQDTLSSASMLNAITLKRQGPYGHPTWKQIRTGEHPLARYYRNNNEYRATEDGTIILVDGNQQYLPKNGETFTFKEPVINSRLASLDYTFGLRVLTEQEDGTEKYVTRPTYVKTVFGNEISYFDNEKLNQIAKYDKVSSTRQDLAYDTLKNYYLDGALGEPESPIYNLASLKYSEKLYPTSINSYTFENRERVGYGNTFWRTERSDRNTLGELKFNGSSSQGVAREQSAWALDGATQFENVVELTTASGYPDVRDGLSLQAAPAYIYDICSAGELQNDYTFAWSRWNPGENAYVDPAVTFTSGTADPSLRPGPMYARPQDINSIYSVVNHTGPEFLNEILITAASRSFYLNLFENASTSSVNTGGSLPFGGNAGPWNLGMSDGDGLGYISSIAGKARFQAHELAGIIRDGQFISHPTTPFYDSYGDFNLEPRLKNKDYSVIPEFRISEEMEFYFNQKSQDFLAENPNFLKIPGTSIASSDNEFYKDYSYSDFMKYFEIIDEDHKDLPLDKYLTLKFKAIKKFIPYDGFFPSERTLEIASLFSSSYLPYITFTGSAADQNRPFDTAWAPRPILAPFMAPGVLFNTIKSGVAVDYPVYNKPFNIIKAEMVTYSGSIPPLGLDDYRNNYEGDSVSTSSYYMLGLNQDLDDDGWDFRVPFEGILNPAKTINGLQMYDMEVNPAFRHSDFAGQMYSTLKAPTSENLYTKAISNFLAETKEFFLNDMATFSSDKQSTFSVPAGIYGMQITMRKSIEYKNTDDIGEEDWILAQYNPNSNNIYETITMYSKPNAFGPPVAAFKYFNPAEDPSGSVRLNLTSSFADEDIGDDIYYMRKGGRVGACDSLFGTNPHFTPPYYDGEARAFLTLSASTDSIMTLDEIFSNIDVSYERINGFGAPSTTFSGYGRPWPNGTDPTGSWGDITTTSEQGPSNARHVQKFCMNLDSSINPFIRKTEEINGIEVNQWVIQTKMETPILNFSDKTLRPLTFENVTLPTNVSKDAAEQTGSFISSPRMACEDTSLLGYGAEIATPIGMWHQFGLIPQGEEGIYLSVDDYSQNLKQFTEGINGVELKSLADLVKMQKGEKRLGQLKKTKTVYEAVVAIPYYIVDGERKFFSISRTEINNAQFVLEADPNVNVEAALTRRGGVPGDSIINMVKDMQKFVLPPRFDFVKNADIDPFAMYIFRFSHTFDQDDLSYIWQNLTPREGKKFEEVTSTVTHKLDSSELLNEEEFNKKVRFMVFKIKQRGNNNYYSIIEGQPEERIQQDNYSYNWPYDYFSLVEFGKMDCQIEYKNEELIEVDSENNGGTDSLADGLKGTNKGDVPGPSEAAEKASSKTRSRGGNR